MKVDNTLRMTINGFGAFVSNFIDSAASLTRLILEYRPMSLQLPRASNRQLIIMGTGPSLTKTLAEEDLAAAKECDFLSVNEGYNDEYFLSIRPIYHVLADPIYWDPACQESFIDPLIEALPRIGWPITFLLPIRARGTILHQRLIENRALVSFFRSTPISGFKPLRAMAFHLQLGMPRVQNVLIAAISLGLWMRYERIAIIGADHTWHQAICIGPDNLLRVRQNHSYDNGAQQRLFLKPSGVSKELGTRTIDKDDVFTMADIFRAWSKVYEGSEGLQVLAV